MLAPRRARVLFASAWAFLLISCSRTGDAAKAKPERPSEDAQGSGTLSVPQADAAEDPLLRLIASATTVGEDADATGLGNDIEMRLVKRYDELNGSMQHVTVLLVAKGSGAIVAAISDLGEDGSDKEPGTLEAIPPHDPPRSEPAAQVDVRLPVVGDVLYSQSFHIPGGDNHIAIVHLKDSLRVYSFWEDEGARADAWELRTRVQLAPHTRLVTR